MAGDDNRLERSATQIGRTLAFVNITLLYFAAIYLLLATLGVQQFQNRGGEFTAAETAKADTVRRKHASIEAAQKRVGDKRAVHAARLKEFEAADNKLISLKALVETTAVDAGFRAGVPPAEQENKPASPQAADAYRKAYKNFLSEGPRAQAAKFRLAEARTALREAEAALTKARQDVKQDEFVILRKIEQHDAQLRFIETYARLFVGMPKDWLTLILALSMGIFGSTIYVTRVFFGQTDEVVTEPSWFFIRPLLGAVIAVVIYLALKAGVIVFATGNGDSAATGDLNPFAVAFLCVVAGIFSERAYRWIDTVSRRYFSAGVSNYAVEPKYASPSLDKEIERQMTSRKRLASQLNVSGDQFDKWIEAKEPVPPAVQSLVSLWLNKTPDELFQKTPSERSG